LRVNASALKAGASNGDHGAERHDDGTHPQTFGEQSVDGADTGADGDRRQHCERIRDLRLERNAGSRRRGDDDGSDGEVDSADQHDQRHADPKDQGRRGLAQDVFGIGGGRENARGRREAGKQENAGGDHWRLAQNPEESRSRRGSAGAVRTGRGFGPLGGRIHPAPWIIRLRPSSSVSDGVVAAAIKPSRMMRMRSANAWLLSDATSRHPGRSDPMTRR
jgi:hypothetical protein